jgi:hypothetical protein
MKSDAEIIGQAKEAAARGDYLAVVRVTSGSYMTDLWAAAMTAHYGPTGTHASRLGEDGRPTAETLAQFPEIAERMERARGTVTRAIEYYERYLARATRRS